MIEHNLYLESIDNRLFLSLATEKYNADKQSWEVQITSNNIKYTAIIDIQPSVAKLVWENRSKIRIYNIRSIGGRVSDLFGMDFQGTLDLSFVIIKAYKSQNYMSKSAAKYLNINQVLDDGKASDSRDIEAPSREDYDKVFAKVEIDAEFPGGTNGWTRYLTREIERNIDELQDDGRWVPL